MLLFPSFLHSQQQLQAASKQSAPLKPSSNQSTTLTAMSFFKSSKNTTSSAASTPAQTPRSSMDASRAAAAANVKMTKEQALELAMSKTTSSIVMTGNIHL